MERQQFHEGWKREVRVERARMTRALRILDTNSVSSQPGLRGWWVVTALSSTNQLFLKNVAIVLFLLLGDTFYA